jgi:hypothetical protein
LVPACRIVIDAVGIRDELQRRGATFGTVTFYANVPLP